MVNKHILMPLLILLVIPFLAITSIKDKSITYDELAHIPAGYTYLRAFDFRMNIEHPPFVKLISAVPLLFMDIDPGFESEHWKSGNEWQYGWDFFYKYNADKYDKIIFFARLPVTLLSMLFGFYVFLFAKELFGIIAGYFALILYVFDPNILAHSSLVTTDIAYAGFGLITIYYFWMFLRKNRVFDLAMTGISLGLALSSKHSGLFLIFILFFIAIVQIGFLSFKSSRFSLKKKDFQKHAKLFINFVIILFIGVIVLASSYFFININAYFSGLDFVAKHSQKGHASFLLGMHSVAGWWYYFPVAFLLKTTTPVLIFIFFSIFAFLIYLKNLRKEEAMKYCFILFPIMISFFVFIINKINIGLRHILIVYPFLFIFISGIAMLTVSRIENKKIIYGFAILLVLWHVFSSLAIYPNYLAFFNEASGGPDNGYNYLTDSNIDWGQDLKGLQKYLAEKNFGNKKIYLSYFGNDNKALRGLNLEKIGCSAKRGINIISVNYLQGFSKEQAECTKWLKNYEPIDKIGYSIFVYDVD